MDNERKHPKQGSSASYPGSAGSAIAGDVADTRLVSIIIGTYNEREIIGHTIEEIFQTVRGPVEVIIVDDSSPDGTASLVKGLNDPRITVIERTHAKGLASAIACGVFECNGDVIGWIDADMPLAVSNLADMINLTKRHDVVVASRFVPGGTDSRHPMRVHSTWLINRFAQMVLGHHVKDYSSCVVVARREVFREVPLIPYGYGDFFIEFVYGCLRRGFDVVEYPYELLSRPSGESKSFPHLGGFIWLGFKYALRVLAARFRPD